MKKWGILAFALLLSACASPRYQGKPIQAELAESKPDVVVVRNPQTKPEFLETMEQWLKGREFNYVVVAGNTPRAADKLTLEYVGYWAWDLGSYMNSAQISAYHGETKVGDVVYSVPNTVSSTKMGDARQRIRYMLEVLFGEITPEFATTRIERGD